MLHLFYSKFYEMETSMKRKKADWLQEFMDFCYFFF